MLSVNDLGSSFPGFQLKKTSMLRLWEQDRVNEKIVLKEHLIFYNGKSRDEDEH